jgi:hypothetical protein
VPLNRLQSRVARQKNAFYHGLWSQQSQGDGCMCIEAFGIGRKHDVNQTCDISCEAIVSELNKTFAVIATYDVNAEKCDV